MISGQIQEGIINMQKDDNHVNLMKKLIQIAYIEKQVTNGGK